LKKGRTKNILLMLKDYSAKLGKREKEIIKSCSDKCMKIYIITRVYFLKKEFILNDRSFALKKMLYSFIFQNDNKKYFLEKKE